MLVRQILEFGCRILMALLVSPMDWAADCGYMDAVKWLHENWTEDCLAAAMD